MQNSPKTVPPSVKHTLRREAGSKVTLDVEVAADRLSRAADAAFERHVQRAKIPGFRPGKAPRGMYERAYGKEHLWEDAADDLMDQTYREIVEAEGIEPIDRPDAKLTQLKEGEPLRYSATVVVRPEVALGDYLAHGAKVEAGPPTEEDVDKTIASMRETHAPLVTYLPIRGPHRLFAPMTLLSCRDTNNPAVASFVALAKAMSRGSR